MPLSQERGSLNELERAAAKKVPSTSIGRTTSYSNLSTRWRFSRAYHIDARDQHQSSCARLIPGTYSS
jgi:hypothetical protein